MANIPIIIDGPNFINRLLEMGIMSRFVSQQLTIYGMMDLFNERLTAMQDITETCSTAEFVCSPKLWGSKENKFTREEQYYLLDRLRCEPGVYIDIINIPGSTEKGVDTSIAGRLEDTAKSADYSFLVTCDRDFIPPLQRLRNKVRVILFDILSNISTDLRNEAFVTIDLNNDLPYLFKYSYPTYPIEELTLDTCADLFANADDRYINQLRVDTDGMVFISPKRLTDEERSFLRFRFESFGAFNGYVGPLAASDKGYIEGQLHDIRHAWNSGAHGYLGN